MPAAGKSKKETTSRFAINLAKFTAGVGFFVGFFSNASFGSMGLLIYGAVLGYLVGTYIEADNIEGWKTRLKNRINPNSSNPATETLIVHPIGVCVLCFMMLGTYALTMTAGNFFEPNIVADWVTLTRPVTDWVAPVFPILANVASDCAGLDCADRVPMYRHMMTFGFLTAVLFASIPILAYRKNFHQPLFFYRKLPKKRRPNLHQMLIRQQLGLLIVTMFAFGFAYIYMSYLNHIEPKPGFTRVTSGLIKSDLSYVYIYFYISIAFSAAPLSLFIMLRNSAVILLRKY